jgi:hypothetical protein
MVMNNLKLLEQIKGYQYIISFKVCKVSGAKSEIFALGIKNIAIPLCICIISGHCKITR